MISDGFSTVSERDRIVLFRQMLAAFAVALVAILRNTELRPEAPLLLGCVICVLAVVPALIWARTMPYNYPIFEIFMATNLTSYGVPLISESQGAELFSSEVRATAALSVVLFQVVAIGVFYAITFRPSDSPFWQSPLFANPSPKWLHVGMVATSVYVVVTTYFWYPGAELVGLLRASTAGTATACTFMLCFMWGQGALRGGDKALLVATVSCQFVIWSTSLVLRQGASIVLLGLVGYFFGRRRVPWIPAIACFALFAVLNLGKYHMRENYWFGNQRVTTGLTDLGGFYWEWLEAGINPRNPTESTSRSGTLIERTSLLHMLCLVTSMSPEPVPFLNGETYWQTFGQLVPRYMWPEKPRGHLSTFTLSIHYGLQNEEATQATTIAFGFLPEAFANFGIWGAAIIGALFAAIYKILVGYSRNSPMLSYGGICIVMVTAWSYQTELTMSIWLTSLFQALAATVGVVWAPRKMMQVDPR